MYTQKINSKKENEKSVCIFEILLIRMIIKIIPNELLLNIIEYYGYTLLKYIEPKRSTILRWMINSRGIYIIPERRILINLPIKNKYILPEYYLCEGEFIFNTDRYQVIIPEEHEFGYIYSSWCSKEYEIKSKELSLTYNDIKPEDKNLHIYLPENFKYNITSQGNKIKINTDEIKEITVGQIGELRNIECKNLETLTVLGRLDSDEIKHCKSLKKLRIIETKNARYNNYIINDMDIEELVLINIETILLDINGLNNLKRIILIDCKYERIAHKRGIVLINIKGEQQEDQFVDKMIIKMYDAREKAIKIKNDLYELEIRNMFHSDIPYDDTHNDKLNKILIDYIKRNKNMTILTVPDKMKISRLLMKLIQNRNIVTYKYINKI